MLRFVSAGLLYPIAERCQGRQIRAKANALRRHMTAGFAERRAWIQTQLATVVARAGLDVPYYRDLFRQTGFDPSRLLRDLGYLQELPYLTKEIIREQGPRMLSDRFNPGQLHLRKTGGSTGPCTEIYYCQNALDWSAAVNLVCLEWAGKRRHMKEAHLASHFPESFPWKDRVRERLKCLVLNRANILTDSFDAQGLEHAWRQLCAISPYLIQGHPSTFYALAVHLRDSGVDARGVVRVFESTGEVLDQKKRDLIEAVFGCRAIDRFGNAELGVVAYERLQDTDHRLKVFDGIAWPELLKHESQLSELVFTGLRNDAMPLLRYRTGDLADVEQAADGFYLRNVVGRVHDVVRIGAHEYPTHYLQDLLDRIGGIDEFQIEPREGSSLLRLVVPNVEHQAVVTQRLHQWWGDALQIEFTNFGGLARQGWRSKFRYVAPQSTPERSVAA